MNIIVCDRCDKRLDKMDPPKGNTVQVPLPKDFMPPGGWNDSRPPAHLKVIARVNFGDGWEEMELCPECWVEALMQGLAHASTWNAPTTTT